HHQALERIARARGSGSVDQLAVEALDTWLAAGKPPTRTPPLRTGLSPVSEWVCGAVSWWLRRAEARQVLAPAELAAEALRCAAADDVVGMKAAQRQLALIVHDLDHPDRE